MESTASCLAPPAGHCSPVVGISLRGLSVPRNFKVYRRSWSAFSRRLSIAKACSPWFIHRDPCHPQGLKFSLEGRGHLEQHLCHRQDRQMFRRPDGQPPRTEYFYQSRASTTRLLPLNISHAPIFFDKYGFVPKCVTRNLDKVVLSGLIPRSTREFALVRDHLRSKRQNTLLVTPHSPFFPLV